MVLFVLHAAFLVLHLKKEEKIHSIEDFEGLFEGILQHVDTEDSGADT